MKVKRAQWAGDVLGEKRTYGEHDGTPAFWNGVALRTQRAIIEQAKSITRDKLDADNKRTVEAETFAELVTPKDEQITHGNDGVITIPAAAYSNASGNASDVLAMNGDNGGQQVFLPRFFPQGLTLLRGGTWKGDADACTSGKRLLSGGYGRYENWGLRAAVTPTGNETPHELTLDLGGGVMMELVYIKPGTFVMGCESTTDGKFECVEVPKHEVTLSGQG